MKKTPAPAATQSTTRQFKEHLSNTTINGSNVKGVLFEAKYVGDDYYCRFFFMPQTAQLFRWDGEKYIQIPLSHMSQKRRDRLLSKWESAVKRGKN
jgi:hypothetical protein